MSLIEASKKVILDCSLPNGAIVAANSRKKYFPKEAKNYYFSWPRDGAYICMAADELGIDRIQEKFFDWCMKAEGWKETGLFYEKYYVNGRKALFHFQPDQTASIIIAIWHHAKYKPLKHKELLTKSANALCKIWSKDHFKLVTQDLWEERLCFPDLKENFSYSLAACVKALESAEELVHNAKWKKTAKEMKKVLLKQKGYFSRSFGKLNDARIDASLLGLVWPFGIVKANDKRMVKTIKLIEEKLVKNGGVYRYEHDNYDGWMWKKKTHRLKGAGYWPLLNFWMAIVTGKRKYYDKVLKDVKGKHLPEQVFCNNIQKSVKPLAWSHAMYVLASHKLKIK